MNKIITLAIVNAILLINNINAQKHDTAYWKAWSSLYKIIDSSFNNRADTSIIEQTALVQFHLVEGKVDTFYIWSTHEKKISNWAATFFYPVVGKYFEGYKKFNHVIVPIRIFDYREHSQNDKLSVDQSFIFEFTGYFKHAINGNFTITQGIILERQWPIIK